MTFQYAYYADYNERNVDSHALLSLASLLTAARYSFSLVILLVVSLGYGLVKYGAGGPLRPLARRWVRAMLKQPVRVAGEGEGCGCRRAALRPALGTTWNKVVLLGGLNFVFSTLYTAALTAKNSDDDPDVSLVLFVVPLAVTLFIFISWVRPAEAAHPPVGDTD